MKLNTPNGPGFSYEIYLYYSDRSDDVAFFDVLNALLSQGTELGFIADIFKGEDVKAEKFISPNAPPENSTQCSIEYNQMILEDLRGRSDVRVVKLYLEKTMMAKKRGLILTYAYIGEAASQVDNHPIGIWTDVRPLMFPANNKQEVAKHNRWARICYDLLKDIVNLSPPSYASLELEQYMPSPTELKLEREIDYYGFYDFYASYDYFSPKEIDRIHFLFRNMYIEAVDHGIFVVTSKNLLPKGFKMGEVEPGAGREVARMVARKSGLR